jgi:chromosome segregation ATPase
MTLDEAVSALKAHSRQLLAVQTIAGAITDVSVINQLRQEAESRRDAMFREVEAAGAKLAEMNGGLKDAQEKVAASTARAASLIADAEGKARAIIEKAQADASVAAEDAITVAKATLQKLTDDAEAMRRASKDMATEKAAIESEIASARAELAEIDAKLDEARGTLSKLVKFVG